MISVIKRTSSVIFHTQLLIAVHDFAAGLQAAISPCRDTCIETKFLSHFLDMLKCIWPDYVERNRKCYE